MATTTNVPSDKFEDLQRDVQDATKFTNSTSVFTNRVGKTIRPIPVVSDEVEVSASNALSTINNEVGDVSSAATFASNTINSAVESVETARDQALNVDIPSAINQLGLQYPPIAYTSGLTLDSYVKTYEYNGDIYIFGGTLGTVTTGSFDETGWQPLQGDIQLRIDMVEFEYLAGGLTLNSYDYPVGTKAHVKSYSAATGGKNSYLVKLSSTGPASKTYSDRLDLRCTDALGAVWELQHSGTVYISSIGGDESADNTQVFRAYDQKADYLDLEGKTWPCYGINGDNATQREFLKSKVFNGKLVVTNSLNGETNVQTFAPFLESEVQLSETKSPIIDWTGLNVLWLGTSIPHQAVGVDGYPERLAEKLNFTVQNWAWSGSHAFYDIDGDAFNNGTIRALSMTEADRLAGLATYGASSAYDDSFDIVTKASQMTTEYRIKRQFESGAIDCVVLDHNHNDRKNIAGYTANDKTINAVVKGTSTTFTLDDVGGLFEGDGCYVRVEGISELDYAAGRITGISGSQVTVAIDSSGMAGTFASGEFKFVDRNTVDGAFDFLIAYTKNMFIRYGSADGKIILCGAPSYFTNDVDRDHAIWSVNRSIKAIADKWGLAFFDVANALRLTYRDHVAYLPDDVHPSTPETRKVFANIWASWMNGGAGNFYNPEEVLQRNKLIDNENNQPALYSKYDESFATRDVIYTEDDSLINDDFSGGLGAWTQLGTGAPAVVSAPWGSGDAVQFDVLADNTAPYIRQNAAVGSTPVLEFDFYMPNVDVATGTTQQVTIASINAAGGAGYSVGIIQTVGGSTQLRATYNQGGFGAAPVVPLPGATLTITDATKYRVKIDVVDGYIFFSVDGVKLYAGAIDNNLLGAASSVLVGPTFTNMGSAFSVFIGNVVAGAKTENHVMTTEELQKTVQSYTFAELQEMSPTLTGRRVICSDRADAPLELADEGYTAQAGDITAANGRVWALVKIPNMPITMFGMVGDGATDNTVAWKGVCDYLNESKGSVVVPSGVFAVTRGAALFHGTITHEAGGIIRNTANVGDSARFWENTALFAGTYFGYDSAYGVSGETQYSINPAVTGDSEVTFITASDSSNFSVGDVVFIKSGEVYPSTTFATGSHVTKVKSVSSGVVELRDKICIDINSGSGSCVIAKQSNALTLIDAYTGREEVAKCADGLRIINGHYESLALDNSQVVHISSIDCHLDFKKVQGQSPFGINPCAHTAFNCKEGNFTLRGGEFAYFHQNVYSELMVFNRIGDPSNDNLPSVPLDFSEYGNSKYLGTVVINDSLATQNVSFASLGFTTPYNHASKLVVNGSNGGNAVSFTTGRAYGSTVGLLEVSGSVGNGVNVDSPDVNIDKVTVRGMTDPSSRALRFTTNSSNSFVGRFITPATDARYTALDLNPNGGNIVESGVVHTSQDKVKELSIVNYAGSGSTATIKTYTISAGTSTKTSKWRAKVIGNITGGSTNGTKTLRLLLGSAIITLNVGAPNTGFFELNLTLSKAGDNLNQVVSGSYQFNGGAVTSFNGIQTTNMATNDANIVFDANLAVGDSFNLREWSVTPSNDIVDI